MASEKPLVGGGGGDVKGVMSSPFFFRHFFYFHISFGLLFMVLELYQRAVFFITWFQAESTVTFSAVLAGVAALLLAACCVSAHLSSSLDTFVSLIQEMLSWFV